MKIESKPYIGFPVLPQQNRSRISLIQPSQPQPIFGKGKTLKQRVEKHHRVVVVGAGVAGLTATYELIKHQKIPTVIMESENKVGGNSKSDISADGIPHPTGATIFLPGNANHQKLWQELKLPLKPQYLLKPEVYIVNGERFTAFGNKVDRAEFAPTSRDNKEAAKGFRKMLADLKKIASTPSGPVVPIQEAAAKALNKWDTLPLSKFLSRYGEKVRALAEPYIKSDLAANSENVSAYVGMLDLEDLNNPRYFLPHGNAFVVQRLAEEAQKAAVKGEEPIQLQNTVEWLEQDKDRVYIKYRDAERKLHVISADAVLMAAPYHVVPQKMKLPKKLAKLMTSIPKSSYGLINIFLKKTPLNLIQFYMPIGSKHISDLVLTTSNIGPNRKVSPNKPSVMCIYTAHTGRLKDQKAFAEEIKQDILKTFPEITEDMIAGIRVNPFKYSMPAPSPGQVKKLREMPRTFGRITLINSDGGAVPSILTAVDEAQLGVKVVKRQLEKRSKASSD